MEKQQVYNPAFNLTRFKRVIGLSLNTEILKPLSEALAAKLPKLSQDIFKSGLDESFTVGFNKGYSMVAFPNGCHVVLCERYAEQVHSALLDNENKILDSSEDAEVPSYLYGLASRLRTCIDQKVFKPNRRAA